MPTTTELREQAKHLQIQAGVAEQSGEILQAVELLKEATEIVKKASQLEEAHDQLKRLSGELNRPSNAIPLTTGERAVYDPEDHGAKFNTNYRPAGWVKSLDGRPLSPAIQPKWVRDQMGENLKAEARYYNETWSKWFRSRKEASFWHLCSAQEQKAMQENTDSEG